MARRLAVSFTNLTLKLPVPPQPAGVTCAPQTNSFGSTSVDCSLPAIPASSSLVLPFDFGVPDAPATQACVTALAVQDSTDAVGSNNTGRLCRTISASANFDLSISATNSPASPVSLPSSMSYTVNIKAEQGTAPKAAVVVDLGDGITELTANAPGWNCSLGGSIGLATCTNSNSVTAPDSYPPIVLTAKVGKCATPFKNDFKLTTTDNNAANNKTSSSIGVRCPVMGVSLFFVSPEELRAPPGQLRVILDLKNRGEGSSGGTIFVNMTIPKRLQDGIQLQSGSPFACRKTDQGLSCHLSQGVPAQSVVELNFTSTFDRPLIGCTNTIVAVTAAITGDPGSGVTGTITKSNSLILMCD